MTKQEVHVSKTVRGLVVTASLSISLLFAASAAAHISIHPNAVPAGAFATLDVRVPGEEMGAHVTSVDVLFPHGFIGVDYENVPGWSVKVIEAKLAQPVEEDGEKIDTEVSQIVWTWTGPLGELQNGQFVDFPLSVAIPDGDAGKALEFRTVQRYSNGQVVRWIEPGLEDEHPSPRIDVTAHGGVLEDLAGDEAGPAAGAAAATSGSVQPAAAIASKTTSSSGKGLAIAALAVAVAALVAALLAVRLQLARRRT
jgi:uncharacterized protein YcnI